MKLLAVVAVGAAYGQPEIKKEVIVTDEPTCSAELPSKCFDKPFERDYTPFGRGYNTDLSIPHPSMIYRHLGRSGLLVSAVSYGAWLTFKEKSGMAVDNAVEMLETAIHGGINFFDNAESYGDFIGESEYIMGLAFKHIFGKGRIRRSDLVIATKLYRGGDGINERGLSRKHILEGMRASLNRLQMDYVDLIFCHRPDPFTPMEETVRAMNFILDQGWAFYWGTSEWSAADVSLAHEIAAKLNLVGPVMDQPLYNMFNRTRVEIEYQPIYDKYNYGLTVYSPLAEGILAGRYLEDTLDHASRAKMTGYKDSLASAPENEKARKLKPIAKKIGCTLSQMSLAWCLKNEHVSTVLMGASRPSQIEDNVRAIDCLPKLTESVMRDIEDVIQSKPHVDDREGQVVTAEWIRKFRYGGLKDFIDWKFWNH